MEALSLLYASLTSDQDMEAEIAVDGCRFRETTRRQQPSPFSSSNSFLLVFDLNSHSKIANAFIWKEDFSWLS
jgi:hypothetical protein